MGAAVQANPWLSIALAALAVIGTLVSVGVGAWFTRRNADSQWVRDQKLKIYIQALHAVNDMMIEVDKAWVNKDVLSRVDVANAINDRTSSVYAAASALLLVAPTHIVTAYNALMTIILSDLVPATH